MLLLCRILCKLCGTCLRHGQVCGESRISCVIDLASIGRHTLTRFGNQIKAGYWAITVFEPRGGPSERHNEGARFHKCSLRWQSTKFWTTDDQRTCRNSLLTWRLGLTRGLCNSGGNRRDRVPRLVGSPNSHLLFVRTPDVPSPSS